MMFEERTRQEVLAYILEFLDALVFFFSKPSQRLSLQMLHCVVLGYTFRIVTFEGILSTSVGAHMEFVACSWL